MAKEKSNVELKRVNINLPSNLVDRVKDYADNLGVNTTSAYIFLLNQALNQLDQIQYMPVLADVSKKIMANPQLLEAISTQGKDN